MLVRKFFQLIQKFNLLWDFRWNTIWQLSYLLLVFPVLITNYSSNVEKDGSLHWNIHSKWNFWISWKNFENDGSLHRNVHSKCNFWISWKKEFSNQYNCYYRSRWTYSTILTHTIVPLPSTGATLDHFQHLCIVSVQRISRWNISYFEVQLLNFMTW